MKFARLITKIGSPAKSKDEVEQKEKSTPAERGEVK
jgi:hypothetical protein